MSDEAYDVALGVLRGFTMGEEVGSQALAVVESQNQALQEEKDRWEARAKRPTAVAIADLDERIAALQEALKEAAMTVHLKHPHAGLTIGPFDSCEHALCTRFRAALSPTQETDPE